MFLATGATQTTSHIHPRAVRVSSNEACDPLQQCEMWKHGKRIHKEVYWKKVILELCVLTDLVFLFSRPSDVLV